MSLSLFPPLNILFLNTSCKYIYTYTYIYSDTTAPAFIDGCTSVTLLKFISWQYKEQAPDICLKQSPREPFFVPFFF